MCVCVNLVLSAVQLCSLTHRCVRVCRRAGASSAQYIGLRKTSSHGANGGNNRGLSTAISNHSNSFLWMRSGRSKAFLDSWALNQYCDFWFIYFSSPPAVLVYFPISVSPLALVRHVSYRHISFISGVDVTLVSDSLNDLHQSLIRIPFLLLWHLFLSWHLHNLTPPANQPTSTYFT